MKTKASLLLLAVVATLIVISGNAWAGQITSVSASPSSITQQAGTSNTNAFTASINSIAGTASGGHVGTPYVSYCSDFTIFSDGSVVCNTVSQIFLDPARNYTQHGVVRPEYDRAVTVTVESNTPCQAPNNVYTLPEYFSVPAGSGVDFGNGVLQVNTPVTVTVTCAQAVNQACSQGYWKNHPLNWPTGYSPDLVTGTTIGSIFTVPADSRYGNLSSRTFMYVLQHPGGGPALLDKANILMVQAIAGVLNEASPATGYPDPNVVSEVNAALATFDPAALTTLANTLDALNNPAGGSQVCDGNLNH